MKPLKGVGRNNKEEQLGQADTAPLLVLLPFLKDPFFHVSSFLLYSSFLSTLMTFQEVAFEILPTAIDF